MIACLSRLFWNLLPEQVCQTGSGLILLQQDAIREKHKWVCLKDLELH